MMRASVSIEEKRMYLEQACGSFCAAFAYRLPDDLKTVLAFCGPASFREPEIDNCWHPYALQRSFVWVCIDQALPLVRAIVGGVRRWVTGRFGTSTFVPNKQAKVLAVTPLSLCTRTVDGVASVYCHPDDARSIAWVLLDEGARTSDSFRPPVAVMLMYALRQWFAVTVQGGAGRSHYTAALLTLRWIVGLQWVTLLVFTRDLTRVIGDTSPERLFCIHEMWPWARAAWSVARTCAVPSVAIQHASIVRNKLWYFPTQAEREAGGAFPNTFAVFSQDDAQLLSPFYPETTFTVGCGPRYAHWKTRPVRQSRRGEGRPRVVLFVTSIPWWDNDTVFQAAEHLMRDSADVRVRIRLHPYAVVPRRWRRWLTRGTSHTGGRLERSMASLTDDLASADVVCGMNSTVLEEAAATGCPVLALSTDRFWSFHKSIGKAVPVDLLSYTNVQEAVSDHETSGEEMRTAARRSLGLQHPVIRLT